MRKGIILIPIAFLLVMNSGCKKEYSCVCGAAGKGQGTSWDSVRATNQKNAKKKCDDKGPNCTLQGQ
jgi:hypothetical protein